MSLWTSLEPASATVDPGSTASVRLRVRNTGDVVDEYRFEPIGDLAPWTRVEPQSLRLYPGTTGTVELTFAPPRTPDATAGPNPYAVRITPTEHPEAVTVPEGNITITPFTEVRAELVPPTVKGRLRGRPRLAVDNLGNTKVTASISGSDNGDHLSYDLHPGNVQIEPGRAAFVKATLKPRQISWFGSKEERPYTLAVQRSGVEPMDVDGTFVQRSFLPGWLATFLGLLLTLAIAFVVIWIAYKPQVNTQARPKAEKPGAELPSEPKPDLTTPPPKEEKPEEEDKGDGSGGGGGGEEQKEKPKPFFPANRVLLQNAATSMCAELEGRDRAQVDGPVRQSDCNPTDTDNQLWNLELKVPRGGPNGKPLFQIRNDKSKLCMDLPDYGAQPSRTPVSQFNCDGTTADNQLWWLDRQPSGDFWIRNVASKNLCLDVAGNRDATAGVRILIAHCSNTDDQEWKIVRTEQDDAPDPDQAINENQGGDGMFGGQG